MTEVLSTTHTSFFVVLPHIIWDFHYNNVYTYLGLFPNHKTVACQVPLSKGFSRQEYWGGLLFPPPGDLPDPGIKPICLIFAGGFFITAPRGKLWLTHKSWLGNMGRISKHSTLQVNHQITPVAIATVNAFRSFSAQSHSVSKLPCNQGIHWLHGASCIIFWSRNAFSVQWALFVPSVLCHLPSLIYVSQSNGF